MPAPIILENDFARVTRLILKSDGSGLVQLLTVAQEVPLCAETLAWVNFHMTRFVLSSDGSGIVQLLTVAQEVPLCAEALACLKSALAVPGPMVTTDKEE